MKILIIGSGGREHALAWKFSKDSQVSKIFVAPGNAGTARENKCENINLTEVSLLKEFALEHCIDLTVVGSEELLAHGIVDDFQSVGLQIFGPNKASAQLEASKAFAKQFMLKHGIKTADYKEFEDSDSALNYLSNCQYPIVIKADGLAAGKGVIIAQNNSEAKDAIMDIMSDKVFGDAGNKVVIEEFLTGVEASILSFTDGKTIVPMLSAKDHKKVGEGETGLNTGGMGAISPNPFVTDEIYAQFNDDILIPTLQGLKTDGLSFSGVIFFGLMINERGVFLLEYNMRMGDPETQTILPLLNNSLTDLVLSGLNGDLEHIDLSWKDACATCIVAAAEGYPESYNKGMLVTGIDGVDKQTECFIAGARENDDGGVVTDGGRVLSIVSLDCSRDKTNIRAYRNLQKINFDTMFYRKDIGKI
ncbi:MAG: phosphoribosylamine--glycine ligase [Gammaproteobacteria bacterium]|nr:phosphoribosylamine--glycine ligase [Gammaproteobacteria bacterium]